MVARVGDAVAAAASANRIANTTTGRSAPWVAAASGFAGTSDSSHSANDCRGFASRIRAASAAPAGSGGALTPRPPRSPNTAIVSGIATTASAASIRTNTLIVLPPRRPIARISLADATPVTITDTTSGRTVMRIAFTQSVPRRPMVSEARTSAALSLPATAIPRARAAPRQMRTRRLSFIPARLHHQVAAIDVQRRAGDVPSGFRRDEADEIGNLERRAETRHRVGGRQAREHFGGGVLAGQLRVDHPRADGVHRDSELAQLLRGSPGQAEQTRLRSRVMRPAEGAHHPTGGGR